MVEAKIHIKKHKEDSELEAWTSPTCFMICTYQSIQCFAFFYWLDFEFGGEDLFMVLEVKFKDGNGPDSHGIRFG